MQQDAVLQVEKKTIRSDSLSRSYLWIHLSLFTNVQQVSLAR